MDHNLSVVNPDPVRLPGPQLLNDLVKPPSDSIALEFLRENDIQAFSYSELHQKADILALRITQAIGNTQGGFIVPVLIRQSPLLYISLLAILKAGGAFCPLNIDTPPERVRFILEDVSAQLVLATAELEPCIPSGSHTVVLVDAPDTNTHHVSHRNPSPEDLAYVMYTSGSTGTPKGVAISHSAATQALLGHSRHIPAFSRFLQFAAPTFDVSVFEIFFPLFRGATLISVHREEMLDDLPGVLRTMRVDACELTPTVAGSLLRKRENAPDLGLILTIGEMLNAPVVSEFGGDDNKKSILWAMYGPTEATIHCTLQTSFSTSSSTGNIGIPLDTVSCFVIEPATPENKDFRILPRGEVGELAVGGHQLAVGYLNRPEQTSASFIDSPYGRVYRTGDKARLLADGTLECLGRLSDGQVKLRGQRLELGEVEAAVLRTQGCHSAVAAVMESSLVVFCAAEAGVGEDDVLTQCRRWLPGFMVPSQAIIMWELPRLPSGKVDKKKLRADFQETMKAATEEEALTNDERAVVRVVSEALGCEVSLSTNLASAGVNSLIAIKLASSLRTAGFNITAPQLLITRTVADLCSVLEARTDNDTSVNVSLLADLELLSQQYAHLSGLAGEVADILPCIPLQSTMIAETMRNETSYCNSIELEVTGFQASEVAAAFSRVVSSNDALRTGFAEWRDGFVSLLFNVAPPEKILVVPEFDTTFSISTPEEWLHPFRIQIRQDEESVRVLFHIHHAIYDGWSMDMILSDVSRLLLDDQEIPHRKQFRAVAEYHANPHTNSRNDDARAFWSEHLRGWNKTPFPKLNGQRLSTGEVHSLDASFDVTAAEVEALSQELGISPQVFFQAGLALLWSAIQGSSDIVLGSVTSGRSIPVVGIESIIGPCIASMPLRANMADMQTALDLLRSIHSSNRLAMSHTTLPLAEIAKLTEGQTKDGLYDVLFAYQESLYSGDKHGFIRELHHLDRLETKVLVEVEPRKDSFSIQLTYHCDSFPKDFAAHFMDQLQGIVRHLLHHSSDSLLAAKAPAAEESIYNQSPTILVGPCDLSLLFQQAAERSPHADALCFAESLSDKPSTTTLSYQQLNASANQIGRFLQYNGAAPGDVIAIIMDKSVNLYTSILGIVKAGCGYLPILPSTPSARVQEIFRQAQITFCLVDRESSTLRELAHQVHFLNVQAAALQLFPPSNLNIEPDASRLAYVIYTSGTTGVPKGVAVTQQNIVSNITYLQQTYPNTPSSRLLQACSQAFDVSVFEIFFTWHAGMCLCTGTNDVLFEDLEHAIRQLGVTHLSLTPTVASLVDPKNVPAVEFLVTAGEPMTQMVLELWGELLWQGYGPSETTNICSVKQMKPGEHIEHLGWVFPNTSIFVMAPESTEVLPIGWVGEFCFGGDQVAHGYLNMSALTAQKFIAHARYGRIYRSGDMGRMLPDGSLVILGRIDDQIKLRGQRIEAGEVNSLITLSSLASSAVTMLVRRDKTAQDQLASFYVPAPSASKPEVENVNLETSNAILSTLQAKLPSYMVPSYLIPVPRIPLTSSGKVDRRELQQKFQDLSREELEKYSGDHPQHGNGEWTDIESRVADVLAETMNVPRSDIGRWTAFATLGIDSISAIRASRALGSAIGRVPISALLQNPTVAQLAKYIDNASSKSTPRMATTQVPQDIADGISSAFSAENRDIATILPCTPLQEAMLSRGQGSYYNKILLRLRMDPEQIRGHWNDMARRHGVLRTCFVSTDLPDMAIVQVVLNGWEIPWKTFDVSVPSLDGAIHEHLTTLPEPLDSKTPPLSMAMIRYRGSVFLSLIIHHALYDGVAMENLWREVECLAHGGALSSPVAYEPFLQQVRTLPEDVEDFWKTSFRGFRPSTLFVPSKSHQIDQCTHTISLDMAYSGLQTRLRGLGVSLLSLCQAAWASVVAISYNVPDISFGNVMSGRTLDMEGLDKLIAPCFNTIPLRVDVSSSSQNHQLLKHFQDFNSKVIPYQFTPLRLVQKIVNRQRRSLFDTLLLLQQPLQEMDERVWTLEEDSGDMDIPLVCEVVPCPNLNSIVVNIHHDMSVVSGDVASTFAELFKHVIRHILGSPFAPPLTRNALPASLGTLIETLKAKQDKIQDPEQTTQMSEQWTWREKQIRDAFSALSRVPVGSIRRSTTIFQLGLDSIHAVQIASALRRKNYTVSASDVMECATCAKLASRLREKAASNTAAPRYDIDNFSRHVTPQIEPSLLPTVEAILPCTPIQSAMLTSSAQSDGANYLNMLSFELSESLNTSVLVDAWRKLQAQHPMLRTGFAPIQHQDSAYAMLRHAAVSVELPVVVIDDSETQTFDRLQWKRDKASQIQKNIAGLCWNVALVQNEKGIVMHLLIHHALYDGQSLSAMLDSLALCIQGYNVNIPSIETALSTVMAESLDHKDAQDFWQQHAKNVVINRFPIMTPLREDKRVMLVHEDHMSISFSTLQELAQRQSATIQAVLQAAWTRVLSSYLGETSVVFGVTMSARSTDELQDAPFPCLATLPIIASNHSSNRDLVGAAMEYNTGLHKHPYAPLGQIQKWLGHAANPVFDTLLTYQKMDSDSHVVRPWKLVQDDATVEYPVSLEIEPLSDGRVRLCVTFFSDVLPREQADLMARQFDATVEHLLRHPTADEDDLYKINANMFSITPAISPIIPAPVRFLHEFVEVEAAKNPHRIALEFVSGFNGNEPIRKTWTYQELDRAGNRVANLLNRQAPVGSIVAIHFNKCPEAYFAILGILKAGCSFVALDPSAPKARKEFILGDSGSPCLLIRSGDALDFDSSVEIIGIDEAALEREACTKRDLGADFAPDATCYCLYTSGTTGTPKGCEITHDNTVQAMMAFQELFKGHWDDKSRWLQFAALHFDVSVLEQYWSWSVGITVVAAPKDLILDDLTGTINNLEITHIDLTPSLARLTHPDEVPSLCRGVFITGGEQLKQEILDAWGPKAVIYNAYGPTEATIGVTTYQRVPINGRPSNIGKQFLNVGSYIFRQGTETPVLRGAVGELCVSGKLVGKGYLNRPELTEERFPTLKEFGERIYRTGDLVRILHDGCFDFLGRADDQVKLRGQRLEIGEINQAILSGVPEIHDVATIVIRHGSSGKDVLVSFIVTSVDKSQGLSVLPQDGMGVKARAACRAHLPPYMVPTYFLRLPHIPLSSNNKAEVKQLKALFQDLSHERLMEISNDSTASVELDWRLFTAIRSGVAEFTRLSPEEITERTSVFDLDVDSITVMQLARFLKDRGVQTSPTLILKNPILADLVAAVKAESPANQHHLVRETEQLIYAHGHRHRNLVCRELGVKPSDIEYIAPCSPLQQGIVSKATTEGQGAYFNTFQLVIENEDVSIEGLREAWEAVVTAHAILRTAFVNTTDGCIQVALKSTNKWQEHVLSDKATIDGFLQDKRAEWIKDNENNMPAPFQILYVTAGDIKTLVIHIFHALYDGSSFDLMLNQVASAYRNKTVPGGPFFLDALTHGLLWQYDDSKDFWVDHLRGWSPCPTPKLSEGVADTAVSSSRTISLDKLESLRKSQNVTMQAVVLSLWTLVLQKRFDNGLAIGVILSGRTIDLPGAESIIGPLFNTLPFFNPSLHGQTWASLVRKCHTFNTSISSFQHTPLNDISKWCTGGRPLFDNLFVFQIEQTAVDDAFPWKVQDGPLNPDYPLAFEAIQKRDGTLRVNVVAHGHIVDIDGLLKLVDEFEAAVSSMSENLDSLVDSSADHSAPLRPVETSAAHSPSAESDNFEWSGAAQAIRDEVASICGLPTADVQSSSTMLSLGIDSIDVIKLSARLKKQGIQISASEIMRNQRMDLICHSASRHQTGSGPVEVVNMENLQALKDRLWKHVQSLGTDMETIEAVLPPTPLQESMVAAMVQSDFQWYFNHDVLEVAEDVHMDQLKLAWQSVIEQSPILRTGFCQLNELDLDMAYCQVVKNSSPALAKDTLINQVSDTERLVEEAIAEARAGEAYENLFQLRFATDGQRRFVVVSIAHALYDGWSLGLTYETLQAAYQGISKPNPTPDLFLSTILASTTEASNQFWSEYLTGVTPTLLPQAETESPSNTISRSERPCIMPLSQIMDVCKSQAISLQTLCHTAWAAVLARRTGMLDVVFGVVLSGREFESAEDLMFPTINTVALRCILHGSVSGFLSYLEENMTDMRNFQSFPLRKAQRAANVPGRELFNSLFMLQKAAQQTPSQQLLKSVEGSSALDYPVCIEAEVLGDQLIWRAACQGHYFSESEAAALVAELDQVMQYLTSSTSAEVLSWVEDGVTICGLEAIRMGTAQEETLAKTPAVADEEWNERCTIIRKVLSQTSHIPEESIPATTSLYHLGLDSISAIKVSTILRKQNILLKPRDLLIANSIPEMARLAETESRSDDTPATPKWSPPPTINVARILESNRLVQDDVQAVLPALPMQVYMLSAWKNSGGTVFFPEFCYRVDGSVKEDDIHEAWRLLVAQTPILRTRILTTSSKDIPMIQVILQPNSQACHHNPLLHFTVHRDSEDWTIRIHLQHALYDAVSLPEIIHRFGEILGGARGEADAVSAWEDFAIQPRLESSCTSRKEFWTNYLQGCQSVIQPSAPVPSERVSYFQKAALSDTARLRVMASTHGISVQSLFIAAYAKLLSHTTQTASTVFGIYLANRLEQGPPTIYPTLNLVPLCVRDAATGSLLEIAARIQNDIHQISSLGREKVGLWEIAEWTGVQISSFVNFLSNASADNTTATNTLVPVRPSVGESDVGIQTLRAWLEYNPNIAQPAFPVSGP
ncbi:putative non-ribosomal peptide synthetase [Stachybotrys elegans]|uniref:Non-ribosomal peptide synthetase n=1 Tax=Stachybotrys elegans TaxID=80388 RepID=A0A8K0SXV9_9HYPO|nr:putative non-ribosomal peptide synthetase [Stachybotrys elegans]